MVSDSRVVALPLERRDRSVGLFVMNASLRQVGADILFSSNVAVSDLAVEVSATDQTAPVPEVKPARRFSLDVPPCGILPLSVDRVGVAVSHQEEAIADRIGALGAQNAIAAAVAELPGLDAEEGGLWS